MDYSVPTLSLSRSRAKRHSSIPTRDQTQSQKPASYYTISQELKYQLHDHSQSFEPQERIRKTGIFPPRPPTTPSESYSREITKNVYLHSPEQTSPVPSLNVNFTYQAQPPRQFIQEVSYHQLSHSSSTKGLLTNPQSSKIVTEQIEKVSSRKTDVGKMLFDRKMTKLFQEASFYEQELLGVCKDDLSSYLEELIEMKESHIMDHRNLIQGLTALIK